MPFHISTCKQWRTVDIWPWRGQERPASEDRGVGHASYHVPGGRSSAAIPEVETQTDVEFKQETEIENPAEIEITIPTGRERDLGTTGPITAEKNPEKNQIQ